MKPVKLLSLLLAAVLALSLCTAGCSDTEYAPNDLESLSADLSSFEAQTLDGGTFTQADFAGKDVTAINFWGTFCTPCISEMPELGQLAGDLPDNVQLISVCIDGDTAPDDARKLVERTGFDVPTLISGDKTFQSLLDQVDAVPTTIFVDADGKLIGNGLPFDFDLADGDRLEKAEMGIILGGGEGVRTTYIAAFNKALQTVGKDKMDLAE